MGKSAESAPTVVRLPVELIQRYDNLAKATGRTRTYYLTEALQESIAQLEYEYGILKTVDDYRAGRLETYTLDEVRQHCGLGD